MCKHILILLFVCKSFVYGQTAVYHPFPESNAIWNVHHVFQCPQLVDQYYTYYFGSDTIIGSVSYHKILASVYSPTPTCWDLIEGYQCAIRQDTVARKVYTVFKNDSIEKVLYDFSMATGDTMWKNGLYCFSPVVVDFVDSVLIGAGYRKRWNSGFNNPIVEGIGSLGDLLFMCEYSQAPNDWILMCYSENGQILFPDTATACQQIVEIPFVNDDVMAVKLYPNPFHSIATLSISNYDGIERIFKIFDSAGRKIYANSITAAQTEIDGRHLASGIYYYRLEAKNLIAVVGRFVVD